MKYILLNQNYGAILDFEITRVVDEIVIEVEEGRVKINSPMTVKLIGDAGVFYYTLKNGKCTVPAKALDGRVSVSLVYEGGVIPCTGIVAIATEGGTVTVLPDAAELTSRVMRAERDISDAIEAQRRTEAKYDSITERLNKLFSGYHY